MLGIKLKPADADRLERVARELRRPKSAIAREWIIDRLEREEIDERIRHAAALHARNSPLLAAPFADDATRVWLEWLDAEDGGYDWGPAGPPPAQ